MTRMTQAASAPSTPTVSVIAGVDTHGETHHAAVLDAQGRELADRASLPDTNVTVARLQRSQDDIGAAIVPYYGQAAGDQVAALLHEHISGAVTLLLAAKAGDARRASRHVHRLRPWRSGQRSRRWRRLTTSG